MQDIQSSVHVPVGHVSAGADVHPVRERLLDLRQRAARATRLRCVARINRYDLNPSFFRFGFEDIDELRPANIIGRLRKEALDVKSLDCYQAVSIHQLASLFVVEVSALVGDLLVQLRYTLASLAALGRALLLPGDRTLGALELLLRLAIVARGFYRRAIRSEGKALESEVYPTSSPFSTSSGASPRAHEKTAYHLPHDLLRETVLMRPSIARCSLTLICPMC